METRQELRSAVRLYYCFIVTLITSRLTSLINTSSLVTLLRPVLGYPRRTFSETPPRYLLSIKLSYFHLYYSVRISTKSHSSSLVHLKFQSSDFPRNSSPLSRTSASELRSSSRPCLEVRTPSDLKGATSYKLKPSPFCQSLGFPLGTPIGLPA